ncbi:hypothetical protein [Streptacidiphilus sp. P02-A3a]|uniref:hypothetical protein n=1 Tax=Streptacidiphilus sp. P02-A3a TaxID=2704468 RepID=UPI0015FD3265|nr:hypothetical protein [Streptacidiphilus sp. P02-A3a]QMU67384.1 hypothetical protein GXP74_03300 [Streptacidiphilus sp. P02-A3a]
MRILLGAQSCGFGPISKLTAVSRALDGHYRVCAGATVAADFAQQNADAFDELIDTGADAGALDREIQLADWVVSVMDADLVFRAVTAGRPVMLVDSLLAFWKLDTPAERIAELCDRSRRTGFATLAEDLAGLSPHEQIYAAHLLADVSAAQNFPGAAERISRLYALGATRVHLTGPIVDEPALADVPREADDAVDVMINIGGFKNFLLDYSRNNEYLRLVSRWVPDLLSDWPGFDRISVCGGGYAGDRAARTVIGGRVAEFHCLPQRTFIPAVASARHYLLTPGLTAIHESLLLGHLPMALPEQHYGHITNLEGLSGTVLERHGSRFAGLIEDYQVPADDFDGTAAIVRHVGRLLEDDTAYARFRRGMNEHLEAFTALDEATRAAGVAELRALLHGPSFSSLLGGILPAPAGQLIGEVR